jgi:hypothetical protein
LSGNELDNEEKAYEFKANYVKSYSTGVGVSKEGMVSINIERDSFQRKWN